MSQTKPIDWTRALRFTASCGAMAGKLVRVVGIDPASPYPITIWLGHGNSRWHVDRAGIFEGGNTPAVENVPPEPRIVERFAIVMPTLGGGYGVHGQRLCERREDAEGHVVASSGDLIARVLIEEPCK